jgi:SNF2 family DNA or RNA helicase
VIETKPWPHQDKFRELQRALPGAAAFFEMGLGKTFATIQSLRELMNTERRLRRTIIFTKPLVVPQWKEEWLKFSKIEPRHITLLQSSQVKRTQMLVERGWAPDGNPVGHIFITNTETLIMKNFMEKLVEWNPEAIVFDESHDLKNPEAARSKSAYLLANPWNKREKRPEPKPKTFILSGSPILNDPLDLFQQIKIMLGGWPSINWFTNHSPQFLVTNFYHFRARYFRDKNAGFRGSENYFPNWQPMNLKEDGFDALGEIAEILTRISVRATKSVLNLPPEIAVVTHVPMLKEQGRVYEEMRDDLISYVSDERACVASLAITKALRLMQIVSGFVSTEGRGEEMDKADVSWKDTPKDEALIDLLEAVTPTSKILVWAVWRENYERIRKICDGLGLGYVEAHGGVGDTAKRECVQLFKNDSKKRVFIGHPGSGGVGLNLIGIPGTEDRCAYSAFYSRNFSLAHYIQARARNHRSGQTENVTHYDLSCKGTIDDVALSKLAEKAALGDRLLSPEKTLSLKDIVMGLKQA